MAEYNPNSTEQPGLTPEQLETARQIIKREQQDQAGEFIDAHESAAKNRENERVQKDKDQIDRQSSNIADIPGITRPDNSSVEHENKPVDAIEDLNASIKRGQKAEQNLEEVLSGKAKHGGPAEWTDLIENIQKDNE